MKITIIVPLLLVGVANYAPIAMAQSPGTFSPTGDMATARILHTAILLPNGKVLIAGGLGLSLRLHADWKHEGCRKAVSITGNYMSNHVLLQLFVSTLLAQNPGTFTTAGHLTTPRSGHSATLLNDGTVLIAGGFSNPSTPTATAELYDPTSGAFTPAGNMTTARASHTATLLPDDRVLLAGGNRTHVGTNAFLPPNSAEIYDPVTRSFSPTGNMLKNHECHEATLLASGKVLLLGGAGLSDYLAPDAELYDPTTGTFSAAGTYSSIGSGFNACHSAVSSILPDGKVMVVWEGITAEVYDPESGTFARTGRSFAQNYTDGMPSATLLPRGTVLIAGGAGDGGAENLTEVFDPGAGAFRAAPNMTTPRVGHTATLLPDGTVIAGGCVFGILPIPTTEIFDSSGGTFTPSGDLATLRCSHTATLLNDGRVLIAGGATLEDSTVAEVFNPAVVLPPPVLLSQPAADGRQGAILHAGTARLVTAADPAVAGEVLEIYSTGLQDRNAIPPRVIMGDRMADVLCFGEAPGFPNLNQINVRVPIGIGSGSAVGVRERYLGRHSNEVTIAIQRRTLPPPGECHRCYRIIGVQ